VRWPRPMPPPTGQGNGIWPSRVLGLMVRNAPRAALLTMWVQDFCRETRPHPEEPAKGGRLEGWATRKHPPDALSKAIALPRGAAPRLPFADFRDDRLFALICPTCQTVSRNAQPIMPAILFHFAWGCFPDFWWALAGPSQARGMAPRSRIGSQTFAAKRFLFT